MATLVGYDDYADQDESSAAGELYYLTHLVWGVAVTSTSAGSASDLYAHIVAPGNASNFRMAIYDSLRNLLGYTGAITAATGVISGALNTSVSIAESTAYFIAITTDANTGVQVGAVSDSGANTIQLTNDSYSSAPVDPLGASSWKESNVRMLLWADGTTGGGSIIPQATHHYRANSR